MVLKIGINLYPVISRGTAWDVMRCLTFMGGIWWLLSFTLLVVYYYYYVGGYSPMS